VTVWLALDTATDTASVALHDGDVIAESTWSSRRRHTVELAPRVRRMLDGSGLAPRDLAGIAVALGPGSYTGLRIALSLAKGIALSVPVQVVGVPTLDILAAALADTVALAGGGELHAVLRAGRGRVVAARYGIAAAESPGRSGQWVESWPDPDALSAERFEQFTRRVTAPAWVAGELGAAQRRALRDAGLLVAAPEASVRRAGWLAALARERAPTASTSVADLSPFYLGGDGG